MANISETKTPKAGEWWLRNTGRGGRIFFICGFDPDGCPVHWNEDVGFFRSQMRFFCKEFHHEPRCTGFGWVEPAEDPNDMPLNPVPGKVVATGTVKLTPVTPSDDWVEITDPGHVLRAGVDQLCVSGHGVFWWEYAKRSAGSCLSDIGVRECRCRRRDLPGAVPALSEIDPNDIPLNPVPGKVVATGTVTFTPVTPTACVVCGVNWALDGSVSCRDCYEYAIEATGCPVKSPDNMAAIIAEHTQQVRELTQRIGELVQRVNERDRVIEQIRTALRQEVSV